MENSTEVPAGQRAGRDRKGKPQRGTSKQQGELAEMGFLFKASGLGFGVAKPWGESESYDFVLDSGKKFWRVQVKSTYVERTHCYNILAKGNTNGKRQPYTASQIDFLVVCIVAENAWYVIPVRAFTPRMRLQFYPSGCKKGGLYEQYREAWDLMKRQRKCGRERPARAAAPQTNVGADAHVRPG